MTLYIVVTTIKHRCECHDDDDDDYDDEYYEEYDRQNARHTFIEDNSQYREEVYRLGNIFDNGRSGNDDYY